jgi:hypothetical protein
MILGFAAPLNAQADWSPEWSPDETTGDVVTYVHASGNAYIVDWADSVASDADMNAMIRVVGKDLYVCPDLASTSLRDIPEGKIKEFRGQGSGVHCSIFAGRNQNRTSVIYTVEADDTKAGTRGLAISFIEKKLGLGFDSAKPAKAVYAAPPKLPPGLAGIWRADWVESRNQAMGGVTLLALNETLVFTPGGYFFHGLPASGALDDTTAKHMIAQGSASAGTYAMRGDRIVLSAGNGVAQPIEFDQEDGEWTVGYLGLMLSKKVALPDGHALEGHYYKDRTNAVNEVGKINDYFFFTNGRFSAFDQTSPGANRNAALNGRYYVKSNSLYLQFDDGKELIQPVFQDRVGGPIWFDGDIWWLAGGEVEAGV